MRIFKQGDFFAQPLEVSARESLFDGEEKAFPTRYYQKQCIDGVFEAFRKYQSTLAVLSTGSGKTVVAAYIVRKWRNECHRYGLPNRVLFLAHREELITQTVKKMRQINPHDLVETEMANWSVRKDSNARIIVASVQSLCQMNRLHKFDPDRFGLIIVDESHHFILKNSTYSILWKKFKTAKLLGLTATPHRTDHVRLADIFESCAFIYSMQKGISDGFLVPVYVQALTIEGYDTSGVCVAEDVGLAENEEIVLQEKVLHGIVDATIQIAATQNRWGGKRQVILFAPSVKASRRMAHIFNRNDIRYGTGKAASIDCNDKFCTKEERRAIIQDYSDGRIQYLCNYNIVSEGTDLPNTRMVVIARPVSSRLIESQMIGRGVRPHTSIVEALNQAADPEARKRLIYESTKPGLLVLEPAEFAGRHNLCNAIDVLAGDEPDIILKSVKKSIKELGKRGKPADVELEISRARARLAEEEEEKKRRGIVIKAKISVKTIDPFGILGKEISSPKIPGLVKEPMATENQKQFLLKRGVAQKTVYQMTFEQASHWVAELQRRHTMGLCTMNQVRQLEKYGFPIDLTKDQANFVMKRIANNNWRQLMEWQKAAILREMPVPQKIEDF